MTSLFLPGKKWPTTGAKLSNSALLKIFQDCSVWHSTCRSCWCSRVHWSPSGSCRDHQGPRHSRARPQPWLQSAFPRPPKKADTRHKQIQAIQGCLWQSNAKPEELDCKVLGGEWDELKMGKLQIWLQIISQVSVQSGEHSSVQDSQAAVRLYTMHRWNRSGSFQMCKYAFCRKEWEAALEAKRTVSASNRKVNLWKKIFVLSRK